MKLSDIKRLSERKYHMPTEDFQDLDLWQDGASGLASADVEVEYEYEGADYTDHPYGSTTAREHHPASCTVYAVKLKKDTPVYDDDGDKVLSTLPAGTDLTKQDWWKQSYTEWLENKIADGIESQESDHDDYRDDDRHDDY